MGCFNSTGFISRLPIVYGQRVVCFIGLQHRDVHGHELYCPDSLVSPIFLPIRGTYDDYGCVENVDRTPIVEAIEKMAGGIDVEDLLNSIERCLYGFTVNDNIKYWTPDENDDATSYRSREREKYEPLPAFFQHEYLHRDGGEVTPVLLFEHEDIYDNLFGGQEHRPPLHFENFNKYLAGLKEIYEKHKDSINKSEGDKQAFRSVMPIPSYNTFMSLPIEYMISMDELSKEIAAMWDKSSNMSILPNANWNTMYLFRKLDTEELFYVYEKCYDELREFVNLWYFYMGCPMYIQFSKTSGEQWFNMQNFEQLNKLCAKKIEEIKTKYENDELLDAEDEDYYGREDDEV